MAPTATVIFALAVAFACSYVDLTSNYYASAKVESSSDCILNRLPDIKQFIFEDLPNYDNIEFKHIVGAELLLFNKNKEEVERLFLSSLSRIKWNN